MVGKTDTKKGKIKELVKISQWKAEGLVRSTELSRHLSQRFLFSYTDACLNLYGSHFQ